MTGPKARDHAATNRAAPMVSSSGWAATTTRRGLSASQPSIASSSGSLTEGAAAMTPRQSAGGRPAGVTLMGGASDASAELSLVPIRVTAQGLIPRRGCRRMPRGPLAEWPTGPEAARCSSAVSASDSPLALGPLPLERLSGSAPQMSISGPLEPTSARDLYPACRA